MSDLSSGLERGLALDGHLGASGFATAPLGKPEPATPSRPSGRVSTDAWFVEVEHEDNIDHEGDPEVYVCNQQTVCTSTVVATIGTHTGLSLDEKVRCARLIAAAPELLEALESLSDAVDKFNGVQLCEGLAGHMQGEMIMARWAALRALAKATGE